MFFRWVVFHFKVARFLWRAFSGLMHFVMLLSFLMTLLMVCFAFSFNLWFPSVAKWYVAHESGFRLTIGASNSALSRGLIDFSGIEIKNPKLKFSQDDCLKINHIMVKANLLTIFNPSVVIEEVTVDVESITCDTSKDGVINVLDLAKVFGVSESEDAERGRKLNHSERNPKSNRSRKKYFGKTVSGRTGNGELPKSFIICDGSQCVVREMAIYLGKIKLHNIDQKGGSREIDINETWNFTDVHSQKEVINTIKTRLQRHGVDLMIQSAFEAIFNLPGIGSARRLITEIGHFSQTFFKGITESMMKTLPSKDDMNLEDNFSKIVDPLVRDRLQAIRNTNSSKEDTEDTM
jgi:hypothetical protein